MYSGTQAINARMLFNRHQGKAEDQCAALVAHIRRLDRKQRNAVVRGDTQQACKLEGLIEQARIRLVDLANPR